MKRFLLYILLLLVPAFAGAQRVGLVLSGGGAKGLAHIGIIRALEEHDIPIDYITGTSMGAIVGSMYAMGYTPDEMTEVLKSEEFKRWYTARIEDKYIYYFKKDKDTPDFISLKISFKDSTTVQSHFLPTSVVNPVQMNLAVMQMYAGATAQCGGDFSKLMVPFRSIASDVYHKKQLIMRNGDLGDAVRASMTFPLMFKPIEIDSTLVYDGGIYNNFPVDVMLSDFNPDIIIGSTVTSNPSKPDEKDIVGQLENMIMQKSDYTLADSLGILLSFKFTDVGLMDFDRIDEISAIGYEKTISMMDSIKSRIPRRVNKAELAIRRRLYKEEVPELLFHDIYIDGVSGLQAQYIKREILNTAKKETFTYEDFKRSYFKLLSDGLISEIIPHAVYNKENKVYDLHLNVKMDAPIAIKLGGNISSNTSNQIYVGVSYKDLRLYSKEFVLEGQLGKVYNNLQLTSKFDFATSIPSSYKLIAGISTFDYFKKDRLFFNNDKPSFTRRTEGFVKLKMAFPFMSNRKTEFSFGLAKMEDSYVQSNIIDFDKFEKDKSTYFLYGGSVFFGGSTLNTRQYPTSGRREELIAQVFAGHERFYSPIKTEDNNYNEKMAWMQLTYRNESYFPLWKGLTLGTYLEAYYSSRNFSHNYTATLIAAGEFSPTDQSKLVYNDHLRSNQYIGFGLKPIYTLSSMFHIRSEFYGFLPIFPIEKNNLNQAVYGKAFSKFNFLGQLSFVCTLPFASVSAYCNYCRFPSNTWNIGLTIGWQIFNERFIE